MQTMDFSLDAFLRQYDQGTILDDQSFEENITTEKEGDHNEKN